MIKITNSLIAILKVLIIFNIITYNNGFICQIKRIKRYQLKNLNVYQWNIMNNQMMNNLNNLNKLGNENLEKYQFFQPIDSTVDELSDEVLMNAVNTSEPGFNGGDKKNLGGGGPISAPQIGGNDALSLKKEIAGLRGRLEKMEKVSLLSAGKKRTGVTDFVDSLQANTLAMNARSVELCSIFAFFTIGTIVGASLLDRLWLLGGIFAAWWASGAVHRDTRGGLLARKVGVQLAQFVRDVQEKYNQFIIFYRTGKLAYISSKTWEQYDSKYSISNRMNEFKKLTMKRATAFNSAFKTQDLADQLSDVWSAVVSAPTAAKNYDKEYGVTSTVFAFGKGLANTVSDNVNSMVNRGSSPNQIRNAKYKNVYNKKMQSKNSKKNNFKNSKNGINNQNFITNFFTSMTNYGSNNHPKNPNYRGRNVDPWRPFWQSLSVPNKAKTENKKLKFEFLEKLNAFNQNENINNRFSNQY